MGHGGMTRKGEGCGAAVLTLQLGCLLLCIDSLLQPAASALSLTHAQSVLESVS